jgi:arylsulfatase A-like enzyme
MVKEAGEFIDKNKAQPFFIYFALNTPHYPYQGSPKWLEHYRDLPYPRNLYAAFLSTTDDRIGALLSKIENAGLTNDTIIIFQSDHGASEEVRAHKGGGRAGPHRGAKFSLYEGGIRVPAIISWPGNLPQNEVRNQIATGCDWFPTIMELCKIPAAEHKIDGKSLLPVINSKSASSAHKIFHWKSGNSVAVREGKWKLVMSGKKVELFDLPNDLSESRNLIKEHPKMVKKLREQSAIYWRSVNPSK